MAVVFESVVDYGTPIAEARFKAGLRNLNPDIHFDLADRHNLYHPNIERWQGVWLRGQHLSSMDRGMLPEVDFWLLDERKNKPLRLWRISWRTTLEAISKHRVPGLDWRNFSKEFGIEQKDRLSLFFSPEVTKDEDEVKNPIKMITDQELRCL